MGTSKADILWIGTKGEIEESLVPRSGLRLETIAGGAIVGVSWKKRVVNLAKLASSLSKASRIIGSFKPDVLLMTGGYVNGPVATAAWLRRVPSVIFLPDIEPGMSIRQLSRFAKRVACTAEESTAFFKPGKGIVTGYPVRKDIRQAVSLSQENALAQFQLKPGKPTLFAFGGSRGARSINRALLSGLPELLKKIQIIHISGSLDWVEVRDNRGDLSDEQRSFYRAYPYLHEEMGPAFRSADLVLARAGASMLGECPAFGLPSILIPYPYAWRYQKVNADYLVKNGAAIRVKDEDLTTSLVETIASLISDDALLNDMAQAAKAMDTPESTTKLAQLLIDIGQGKVK